MTTCTLPRHPTQGHHWTSYGGKIAGIRQMPQVQISGIQTTAAAAGPPPPPSQIAMHHLNTRAARHCIPGGGGVSTGINLVDDEMTIETPLMLKRESTV